MLKLFTQDSITKIQQSESGNICRFNNSNGNYVPIYKN